MRILIANPNTTEAVTELMLAAGRAVAGSGTELVGATAPRGVPYISTAAEAQIGGAVALEMLADEPGPLDAAIIAAFGDPGLVGARELFDFPVVGLAEAAMLTACMLGRRFSIITFSAGLVAWYGDCVRMHGLGERCASIRALGGRFSDIATVAGEKEELLVKLAGRAVDEDGAEALIFSGAPLSGMAARVGHRLPVPTVDQVAAAVRQAETLAMIRAGQPRRLPPKPSRGLPPALARRLDASTPERPPDRPAGLPPLDRVEDTVGSRDVGLPARTEMTCAFAYRVGRIQSTDLLP